MAQDTRTLPAAALATRLAFLVAGFIMACWAPLIPFAKTQVGASEGVLGLLLLCLGLGSIVAMPVTGYISARTGARPMILLGGYGLVLLLPALVLAETVVLLGIALALFGAALGTVDVAMNVHAAEVEARTGRPMMSGFHAMWSVGGILGAWRRDVLALGRGPRWSWASRLAGSGLALAALLCGDYARASLRARASAPQTLALCRRESLLVLAVADGDHLPCRMRGARLGAVVDRWRRGCFDATAAGTGYLAVSRRDWYGWRGLTGDRIRRGAGANG